MRDFMTGDEPNFIFKNINAVLDMGLIIENNLPEVSPKPRINEISTLGRNGTLHEWFGDYEAYDFQIRSVSCPYDRIEEVKDWLRGSGKLITHNDQDKYREVRADTDSKNYENEWGEYYTFDILFRSQPFRKTLRDIRKDFSSKSKLKYYDEGQEVARPYFEIEVLEYGNFALALNDKTLTVINAMPGIVTIDSEWGKVFQENSSLRTKGEWPLSLPGWNTLSVTGNVKGKIDPRSVWL